MVSFYPSTSFRSGSSLSNLSDLSDFKALQDTAKKKFGLQSVIFRDNLETAHDVMLVLEDLQQSGYDLSGISIMVSEKASQARNRWSLNLPDDASDELINQRFQSNKYMLLPLFHYTKNPNTQKKLLQEIKIGGSTSFTLKGKEQRPLVFIDCNYQDMPLDKMSSKEKFHAIYHEIGHALHYKNLAEDLYAVSSAQEKTEDSHQNIKSKTEIIEAVNRKMLEIKTKVFLKLFPTNVEFKTATLVNDVGYYASVSPEEHIPEYWIFQRLNPLYRNEAFDTIYKALKGPEILPKPSEP